MIKRTVTMHGLSMKLLGEELVVGAQAPAFRLIGNDLKPITLQNFEGQVLILSCVPSLDTPVCDIETRHFNQEAAAFSKDIVVLTVSKDLPFAQARYCAAQGIDRVITASDYRNTGFALQYGVLLEDLGLLTRAVFVIDKEGIVQYIQFVPEVTYEPDYSAVLAAAKKLVK